jgi:hypothetical protein
VSGQSLAQRVARDRSSGSSPRSVSAPPPGSHCSALSHSRSAGLRWSSCSVDASTSQLLRRRARPGGHRDADRAHTPMTLHELSQPRWLLSSLLIAGAALLRRRRGCPPDQGITTRTGHPRCGHRPRSPRQRSRSPTTRNDRTATATNYLDSPSGPMRYTIDGRHRSKSLRTRAEHERYLGLLLQAVHAGEPPETRGRTR